MIDGGNFNASDAVIALGVGKNMVSSIRYWLKVFGISNQDEPSRIADYLFDESEGVDKYIESLGTLWLLHYLLVSLQEATLYRKRIRDAALSTFIHHYTFAAKSKSIKYDSRRTI